MQPEPAQTAPPRRDIRSRFGVPAMSSTFFNIGSLAFGVSLAKRECEPVYFAERQRKPKLIPFRLDLTQRFRQS